MKQQPKTNRMLSVIIPTYNRPTLAGKAVKSILDQIFTDLEVIVIDGSDNNDTEKEIALLSDERIRYFKVANQSAAHSRNIGMKMAQGEFVAFNDDDDEWHPDKAEKQLQRLTEVASKKIIYCSFIKEIRGSIRATPDQTIRKKTGNIYSELLLRNFVGLPTMILHRSCCQAVLFDESLKCIEDWDWTIRLAKIYDFEFIENSLVTVNDTPSSVNKSAYSVKAESYRVIYEKHCTELKKTPFIEAKHLLSIGNNLCLSGDMRQGRKYLIQSFKVDRTRPLTLTSLLLSFLGNELYIVAFKFFERLTSREP
jgi:glycosyltransferase involved in cell wall biosynthesis